MRHATEAVGIAANPDGSGPGFNQCRWRSVQRLIAGPAFDGLVGNIHQHLRHVAKHLRSDVAADNARTIGHRCQQDMMAFNAQGLQPLAQQRVDLGQDFLISGILLSLMAKS